VVGSSERSHLHCDRIRPLLEQGVKILIAHFP
jgi:hypothetical protein